MCVGLPKSYEYTGLSFSVDLMFALFGIFFSLIFSSLLLCTTNISVTRYIVQLLYFILLLIYTRVNVYTVFAQNEDTEEKNHTNGKRKCLSFFMFFFNFARPINLNEFTILTHETCSYECGLCV